MSIIDGQYLPPIEVPNFDLVARTRALKTETPYEAAPGDALLQRREFLHETIGGRAAESTFERIIGGDELQPVNYLERGAIAARAICRVDLGGGSAGTGFLIAPGVLITNNHVLPDAATAAGAVGQFQYELDLSDEPLDAVHFSFDPSVLFHTSVSLDFTVVAVVETPTRGILPLAQFGCLPLLDVTGKASEGEWLTVVQHPDGGRKQVCVRDNQLIKRGEQVLWYSTDTKPGSSGSPAFNNDWYVVALHHRGILDTEDGASPTNPGGPPKWIANEGVRASVIARTLRQEIPDHPLLQPLFTATPASARIVGPVGVHPIPDPPKREIAAMAGNPAAVLPLEIRLQVQADGRVVQLDARAATESLSPGAPPPSEKTAKTEAKFDAPFDPDYSHRKGLNQDFLGKGVKRVRLPVLDAALEAVAAPLIDPVGANKYVLHYDNYSVVMHAERRFAIYSAANVAFNERFDMIRPPDVWRRDPRLLAKYQIENWFYASNKFDRGHLTRREDLEFGPSPDAALKSAGDTCHWTNCTPQHERFNQNREIWQGIERYILEESIRGGNFNAQIFTGPIFDEGDPDYREIQYPLRYWKVVAAVNASNKLFATAYIASQAEVIDQFGIEVTEVPFGPYKTFQTKIAEIERLTGLSFQSGTNGAKPLRDYDPLEGTIRRPRRRARAGSMESTGRSLPPHYYEISVLDDIQV
jgi:endonuclease G